MAQDANFSYPVLLTEVSSGFLSSKRCLYEVFFLLPPPNLCFGTALLGSPLAEDKSFIMVNLPLLLCLQIIFISAFCLLQARIRAFSSLLLYFPGMLKWFFQKQTPH